MPRRQDGSCPGIQESKSPVLVPQSSPNPLLGNTFRFRTGTLVKLPLNRYRVLMAPVVLQLQSFLKIRALTVRWITRATLIDCWSEIPAGVRGGSEGRRIVPLEVALCGADGERLSAMVAESSSRSFFKRKREE